MILFRWVASLISLHFTEIKAAWRPFTTSFQEDRGEQKLAQSCREPWAIVTAREAHAGSSPFPCPQRGFTGPASHCRCECQNCDLHGKAAKVGTTEGSWAHLGHWETPWEKKMFRPSSHLASHHLQSWSEADHFSPSS